MKPRPLSIGLPFGLLLPLLAGCATKALWENQAFNEPDCQPELRLYYVPERQDVLVQYTEFRECQSDRVRRSYFLNRNEQRLAAHRKPRFVDAAKVGQVSVVPVVSDGHPGTRGGADGSLYAAWSRGESSFTLYARGRRLGAFSLPVYPDRSRRLTQIALTPFTVVLDATVVGGVVALCAAKVWAESGGYMGTF